MLTFVVAFSSKKVDEEDISNKKHKILIFWLMATVAFCGTV
jgi:hypothetical protein